ncbi:unnamed protein product [Macrosiphum euphorbiae]|uniref:Uncharacterized protein n=1 Tax=Macrosiphum euphorbiae TaxID=13131 RepID=A0AAV0W8S1_9HEMI|nr:unnamed protein product [Macrosiphum euphorbiae]
MEIRINDLCRRLLLKENQIFLNFEHEPVSKKLVSYVFSIFYRTISLIVDLYLVYRYHATLWSKFSAIPLLVLADRALLGYKNIYDILVSIVYALTSKLFCKSSDDGFVFFLSVGPMCPCTKPHQSGYHVSRTFLYGVS